MPNPAVQLAAAPNPFEFHPQVALRALFNAVSLVEQYSTVPCSPRPLLHSRCSC